MEESKENPEIEDKSDTTAGSIQPEGTAAPASSPAPPIPQEEKPQEVKIEEAPPKKRRRGKKEEPKAEGEPKPVADEVVIQVKGDTSRVIGTDMAQSGAPAAQFNPYLAEAITSTENVLVNKMLGTPMFTKEETELLRKAWEEALKQYVKAIDPKQAAIGGLLLAHVAIFAPRWMEKQSKTKPEAPKATVAEQVKPVEAKAEPNPHSDYLKRLG